jgi:LysR family positive regulator for ilvC
MDHASLKLFLQLADTLHFGATSRMCNISPSALSRQIQRLEEAVGHRLFDRDHRTVRLTDAGKVFRRYARSELELWRGFAEELEREETVLHGEVSIYCSVTASLSMLPNALAAFRAAAPVVRIRLQTGDAGSAVEKVMAGDVDFGVSALPASVPEGLVFHHLAEVKLVFVVPKATWKFSAEVASGDPLPWEKIPLILGQNGVARERVDEWLRRQGIQPDIYARVAGNEGILSMVALGCGAGVVPEPVLTESSLKQDLLRLEVANPPESYQVGVCARESRIKNRLQGAFWAALQGTVK